MRKLIVLLLALAAAATLTGPAAAALSGPLRISFAGSGSKAWGVCSMNPDGTNQVCVHNGYRPVAAPGGDFLYFQDMKDDDTTNYRAIYRVRNDGSDLKLIHFRPFDFGPVSVDVSPDGTKIVYDRYVGNSLFALPNVFIANADGTGEVHIAGDDTFGVSNPSFSPDGSEVVFFGCPTAPINEYGNICVVSSAGGNARVIAKHGEDPRWGRNGQISYRDIDTGHVILVDRTGTNRIDTGIVGAQPALSPDGRQVAFTRYPALSNVYRIWVANVDGSGEKELTVGERPVWFQGTARATATPPAVTVTSPTGGEIVGGKPVTFTWTATGDVASQSIVLEDTDPGFLNGSPTEPQNPDRASLGFTIVANLPGNVRSYTWTPPASMNWKQRRVRIAVTDSQGQVAVGLAGPVTTRPAPDVPPYVRVAYPSEPTQITWYTGGSGWASFVDDDPDGISRLEARLSLDGGLTFPIVLATGAGWTTILGFTVPDVPSTATAMVKVTAWDAFGNASSDVSDNPFSIVRQAAAPPPAAALSGVSVSPTTVAGGTSATGTVTLTAAAPSGGASVGLTSSDAAASVPASVTVPAGASSATFAITTKSVTASTVVTVTASYGGATRTAALTVGTAAAADKVSVTRAEYTVSKKELRLEASSSSSSATLKVYVAATNELIGTLSNLGGGKYGFQGTWPANPQSVVVRSSGGGSATASVVAK